MINLESIYNLYLDKKNIENRKKYDEFKGWYSASTAGSCHKKQYYKVNDYDEEPFDNKVKRLLRLGTVVHKDFEEALNWYNREYLDERILIMTEQQIKLPELNVVGHLDAVHINLDTENITLFDLKTIGDWPWKMRFGKKKKLGSTSNRYFLQVGTYVLGLKEMYPDFDYEMMIVWYNKNNSMMREQKIYPEWSDEAFMYWEDLKEEPLQEDIVSIKPHESINIPVEKWECDYCNYNKQCKIDTLLK